jgi:hypothetical protein
MSNIGQITGAIIVTLQQVINAMLTAEGTILTLMVHHTFGSRAHCFVKIATHRALKIYLFQLPKA